MQKPKPKLGPQRTTNPLIWCAAVICALISVAVIIAGIVVFVGYIVVRPKIPVLSVPFAHLDKIYYDQAGILTVQISIVVKAENGNEKAHASFYDTGFLLRFHGVPIAKLATDPFDVGKNRSIEFRYLVESSPIPLGIPEQEIADSSLKQNLITFELKGSARTRWRVGLIGSVKFRLRLDCELHFFPSNLTSTRTRCSSSKY